MILYLFYTEEAEYWFHNLHHNKNGVIKWCDLLNKGACFDFDYTPTEGEVLRMKFEDKWYRYRVDNGIWIVDKSTRLTSWRAQMVYENLVFLKANEL